VNTAGLDVAVYCFNLNVLQPAKPIPIPVTITNSEVKLEEESGLEKRAPLGHKILALLLWIHPRLK